jgi:hypothetical protein
MDENKDSVDTDDTAGGGDVEQYLDIGMAAHHVQGTGPFPYGWCHLLTAFIVGRLFLLQVTILALSI